MGFTIRLNLKNATSIGSFPPRDPALAAIFGGLSNTSSGERVTPETSLQVTAVLSAIQLISDTIASLPLFVLQRDSNGDKTRIQNHDLAPVLRLRPNKWQTAFEFWQMMMGHVLLRGNGYAQIVSTPIKGVSELIPLHPDRVEPFRAPDGSVAYMYQPLTGGKRVFLQDEMFHIIGAGSDGLKGVSVITHARETIGLSLAVEKYAGRYFANDASPGGVLEHPTTFKNDETYDRFRDGWQAAQSGKNKHKTAVLEEGMQFKQLGMTNKDSQFLELRQFQVADIARIFRVPPHLLYDLMKSSFNNIEQQSIEFVEYTLNPWVVRIEQVIWRDLFTTTQQNNNEFAEFLLQGLLRGDIKTRTEAYQKGIRNGYMSVNEVRRMENLNSIGAEGNVYYVSSDLVPVKVLLSSSTQPERVAAKLMEKAAMRLAKKDAKAVNNARQRLKGKELELWVDEYYQKQIPVVADAMLISTDDVLDYINEWKYKAFMSDIDIQARTKDILEAENQIVSNAIDSQKLLTEGASHAS